jgi:hypothetical protein
MRLPAVAACLLLLPLAACSSGSLPTKATDTTTVLPISDRDLHVVVEALCQESTFDMATVVGNVAKASGPRAQRILAALDTQCHARFVQLETFLQ